MSRLRLVAAAWALGCLLSAASARAEAEGAPRIRLPEPEFQDLSVGFWPGDAADAESLKAIGIESIRVFTGAPRNLRGVDVLVLVDGWDAEFGAEEEGGGGADAGQFAALLRQFVEAGGTLAVFAPDEPGPDVPAVLPVPVKWAAPAPREEGGKPPVDENVFPLEFLEPDHPAVREMGDLQDIDAAVEVSAPAKVIARTVRAREAAVAATEPGKGRVVLFGWSFSSLSDAMMLRNVCLWASGAAKAPPADADPAKLAAAHLAKGFGMLVEEEIAGLDGVPYGAWRAELAKARRETAALTELILDERRPDWRAGTDNAGWKAVEGIIFALASDDPAARYGARWSLAALVPMACAPLEVAAKSQIGAVKAGAEETLYFYRRMLLAGGDAPENVAKEALSGLEEAATTARRALGIVDPPEKLVALLGSADPARAIRAAEDLGRSGDARVAGPLGEALLGTKDEALKRAAAAALARIGGPETLKALKAAVVASRQVGETAALCEALVALDTPEADEAMTEVVSRPNWTDEDVRRLVQLASRTAANKPWRAALMARALGAREPGTVIQALYSVREWDDPKALVVLLDHADTNVRVAAAAKLAGVFWKTHSRECLAALVRLLDHEDLNTRRAAFGAISSWASMSGRAFSVSGNDDEGRIKSLKEWLKANPDFPGRTGGAGPGGAAPPGVGAGEF